MNGGQMLFNDFMIDIETTGLEPNRNAIIQISAVPFDFKTRQISNVYFDKCLAIPNWRSCDDSTMTWWRGKNLQVFNTIISRMESPSVVMREFADFIRSHAKDADKHRRFWFKRPFDWQFVEGYFNDFEVGSPFHYHNAIEMSAYLKGVARDVYLENIAVASEGPAHDAYYDARLQIKKLFATIDYYGAKI